MILKTTLMAQIWMKELKRVTEPWMAGKGIFRRERKIRKLWTVRPQRNSK